MLEWVSCKHTCALYTGCTYRLWQVADRRLPPQDGLKAKQKDLKAAQQQRVNAIEERDRAENKLTHAKSDYDKAFEVAKARGILPADLPGSKDTERGWVILHLSDIGKKKGLRIVCSLINYDSLVIFRYLPSKSVAIFCISEFTHCKLSNNLLLEFLMGKCQASQAILYVAIYDEWLIMVFLSHDCTVCPPSILQFDTLQLCRKNTTTRFDFQMSHIV